MKVTVVTAFPEFFRAFLETSIVGRGVDRGLLQVSIMDLREYGEGGYRQIDDYSFGGNGGMVLMADPLAKAVEDLDGDPYVVYPSPQGVPLTQDTVESLYTKRHIVIVCGHYEGVDERFTSSKVDLELSIGDYVLTGGELPAMVIIDAISRLVPGVVGKGRAVVEDSFFRGMLDNSHFTRPSDWRGMAVPAVLLSGDDRAIDGWRRRDAVERTLDRRPDLLGRASLRGYLDKGYYVIWVPSEPFDLGKLDSIARCSASYGVSRLIAVFPDRAEREDVKADLNRNGLEKLVKLSSSIDAALEWIAKKEKALPCRISLGCDMGEESASWIEVKGQILRNGRPAVFVFGDGVPGDIVMRPVAGDDRDRSALPVQNAISVILDRFFGWR